MDLFIYLFFYSSAAASGLITGEDLVRQEVTGLEVSRYSTCCKVRLTSTPHTTTELFSVSMPNLKNQLYKCGCCTNVFLILTYTN